jgi:hypothetical protein
MQSVLSMSPAATSEDETSALVPSLCFQSVNRVDTLNNTGEAFVDDSNLGCTFTLPVIPHHVSPVDQRLHSMSALTNLQMLAQGWE